MRTKEEYYELVQENRRLAADPKVTRCPCPNTLCDWHGKCKECVALHRYHKDHVPFCLQPIRPGKGKGPGRHGGDGAGPQGGYAHRVPALRAGEGQGGWPRVVSGLRHQR